MTAHRALRFVHAELHPPVYGVFRRMFEKLAPGRSLDGAPGDSISDSIAQIPGSGLPGDGMEKSYQLTIGGTITVDTEHGLDFTTSPLIFRLHAPAEQIDAAAAALVEAASSEGFTLVPS